jgi:hypothetical protein
MQATLVGMRPQPGQTKPHTIREYSAQYSASRALTRSLLPTVWGFVMSVARHPASRMVVLVLLIMLQMVLLWLLGQMIDLCLSLMEVWVELARKHLELTL